jgi:hypothetical protein
MGIRKLFEVPAISSSAWVSGGIYSTERIGDMGAGLHAASETIKSE